MYAYVGNNPVGFVDPMGLEKRGVLEKVWDGDYVGTQYGQDSTNKWATWSVNADTWYESLMYDVGGGFAALWTPDTWKETAMTLAGGWGAGRQAAAKAGQATVKNAAPKGTNLGKVAGKNNAPKSTLPRNKAGEYLPDPRATGKPHTTLGRRVGKDGKSYTQGAMFDSKGKFIGRTDVTNHGRFDHLNPHFHPAKGPASVFSGSFPISTP